MTGQEFTVIVCTLGEVTSSSTLCLHKRSGQSYQQRNITTSVRGCKATVLIFLTDTTSKFCSHIKAVAAILVKWAVLSQLLHGGNWGVGCSGASGTKLLHTVARRCIVLYRNIDFKKKL